MSSTSSCLGSSQFPFTTSPLNEWVFRDPTPDYPPSIEESASSSLSDGDSLVVRHFWQEPLTPLRESEASRELEKKCLEADSLRLCYPRLTKAITAVGGDSKIMAGYMYAYEHLGPPPIDLDVGDKYWVENARLLLNFLKNELSKISKLDLSNLGLKILPPELSLCTGLKELDLSGNALTSLGDFDFSGVDVLDLSFNEFISFESSGAFSVILDGNLLEEFPKSKSVFSCFGNRMPIEVDCDFQKHTEVCYSRTEIAKYKSQQSYFLEKVYGLSSLYASLTDRIALKRGKIEGSPDAIPTVEIDGEIQTILMQLSSSDQQLIKQEYQLLVKDKVFDLTNQFVLYCAVHNTILSKYEEAIKDPSKAARVHTYIAQLERKVHPYHLGELHPKRNLRRLACALAQEENTPSPRL